jgi:divalent metal cation (Fe/Co/Zn/Cd) transporter
VSLGVVASAALVALGLPRGDPIVGLLITLLIFKITFGLMAHDSRERTRSGNRETQITERSRVT